MRKAPGDAQPAGRDEAFVCTTKDRMAAVQLPSPPLQLPPPLPPCCAARSAGFGASLSSATDLTSH